MPRTATADRVDRAALEEFLRPRHKAVLLTRRSEGGVQLSPVTCGLDQEGRVVVSTYPQRAKAANARRDPAVSLCVLSDDFDGPWV
jgi:PPOX class probable F420-dependent enzyme